MPSCKVHFSLERTNPCFLTINTLQMAKIYFINQLKALGINPQEPSADKLYFEWTVPVGGNLSKRVLMGFIVNNDFPLNCPTGPHIKALDGGWIEHPQNIHNHNFGQGWTYYPSDQPKEFYSEGWRYWSRPCPTWNCSDKSVKYYLAHIKNIMMT